ncbi:MAG: hypothetical protein ACE5QV_09775 [Fidelibacterota bacterium]
MSGYPIKYKKIKEEIIREKGWYVPSLHERYVKDRLPELVEA